MDDGGMAVLLIQCPLFRAGFLNLARVPVIACLICVNQAEHRPSQQHNIRTISSNFGKNVSKVVTRVGVREQTKQSTVANGDGTVWDMNQ